VAIDGPGGAGKSSVARAVADRLDFEYLDTGAMYRAVGLLATEAGVSLDDEVAVARVAAAAGLRFSGGRLVAGERDLTEAIRTLAMGEAASRVSALPAVRRLLVEQQRALASAGGVVMEGRDIGTNVFPDAPVKVYLTADPAVRAERRRRELVEAGEKAGLDEVLAAVLERDRRDSTRTVAPLCMAADAVELDTSAMTFDEVVATVERLARERLRLETEKTP
jgi:cytidylate kinase